MTSIQAGPHYEISSSEVAAWVEQKGRDRWWNVDGDPLLTGRLTFPCPADELAEELRKLDRPLLVQAQKDDSQAKGQSITANRIDETVAQFAENLLVSGTIPPWAKDRFLYLCWKDSPHEWLLSEDSATTDQYRADVASKAK